MTSPGSRRQAVRARAGARPLVHHGMSKPGSRGLPPVAWNLKSQGREARLQRGTGTWGPSPGWGGIVLKIGVVMPPPPMSLAEVDEIWGVGTGYPAAEELPPTLATNLARGTVLGK